MQVRHMLKFWEAKIVVAIVHLPIGLAKALLESGAKAVICRQANSQVDKGNISLSNSLVNLSDYFARGSSDQKEDRLAMSGFFEAFYRVLLAGFPIVKALAAAGKTLCIDWLDCSSNASMSCNFSLSTIKLCILVSWKEHRPWGIMMYRVQSLINYHSYRGWVRKLLYEAGLAKK